MFGRKHVMLSLPVRLTMRILLISLIGATLVGTLSYKQIRNAQVSLLWNATEQKIYREFTMHRGNNFRPYHKDEDAEGVLESLVNHSHFDAVIIYDANGRPLKRRILEHGAVLKRHDFKITNISGRARDRYHIEKQSDLYYISELYFDVRNRYKDMPNGPAYFGLVKVQHKDEVIALRHSALSSALATALIGLLIGLVVVPVVRRLFEQNQKLLVQMERNYITLVKSMGVAIASRDSNTGNHCYRSTLIALAIAEKMRVRKSVIKELIVGSLLHDVGKIAISDDILRKPSRLSAEETAIVRTHVEEGVHIIGRAINMPDVVAVVASHHERWDGTGYPQGLKGDDIPLVARIFAVADVFDSLASERPYKAALPFEKALEMIEKGRNSHFDARIVDAFTGLARQLYDELEVDGDALAQERLEQKLNQYFNLAA